MKLFIYIVGIIAHMFISTPDAKALNKLYFLKVEGNVRDAKENKCLDSVRIGIFDESQKQVGLYYSDKSGNCNFKLKMRKIFTIKFSKKGYVTKIVNVDASVPINKIKSYPFLFDINLFEEIKDIDVSILKKPIATVSFANYMNCFFYNYTYTDMVNNQLNRLYQAYYRSHPVPDSLKYSHQKEMFYVAGNGTYPVNTIPANPDSAAYPIETSTLIPEDHTVQTNMPEVVFKIQVLSVKNHIPECSPVFSKCGKVEEYVLDDTYKYTIGEYGRLEDAKVMLSGIINIAGYNDAFIVAFVGKKRITVWEALLIKHILNGGL